jgi:type II secretory pathway component PulK
MRIRDIIVEDHIDDMLEDEADGRGDANLITTLEFLRNRAHDTHVQPRVRADSLINLVQKTGEQQFTLENLLDAYSDNENIKALIKDIKDDSSGVKYVYLQPFADDTEIAAVGDENAPRTAPEKTVDAMAKSALAKRG